MPYFGRQPQGRLTYTADGRVHAILVLDDRPHLAGVQISGPDKIRLFDSMINYSGTYEILGEQVIHTVDISWNEAWSGQKLIRFFKLAGDELHISTAPSPDLLDGEVSVYIVEWWRMS